MSLPLFIFFSKLLHFLFDKAKSICYNILMVMPISYEIIAYAFLSVWPGITIFYFLFKTYIFFI